MTSGNEKESDETFDSPDSSVSWKLSAFICGLILAVAVALAAFTFATEPEAERGGATKKTAMLVEVVEVERGTFRPRIVATGTVEAAQDVVLRPEVGGRIVARAPGFVPGGFVEKGETLVRIEAADYRYTLAQRESDLRDALAELADEQGLQAAARADYEYLGEDMTGVNEELVLRKAQLGAARERVEAARAAIEQAKLNLRRTTVRAPFDAHVLRRDVNVGSQVSPTDSLGRMVGLDEYWVAVEVPLAKLRWLSIPRTADDDGAEVRVRNRKSWAEGVSRTGRLFRLVGALDGETRMARVLASIPDPLARGEGTEDKPPLIVGEFVETTIRGMEIEDVVRLDRDYVRGGDTVWTMVEGELRVNEVDIVVQDAEYAYVSGGLEDGDRVVTTNLSTVVEGAPLRVGAAEEGATE